MLLQAVNFTGYQLIRRTLDGLASHPEGSRNTPSRFMLQKPEISTTCTRTAVLKPGTPITLWNTPEHRNTPEHPGSNPKPSIWLTLGLTTGLKLVFRPRVTSRVFRGVLVFLVLVHADKRLSDGPSRLVADFTYLPTLYTRV